MSIIDDFKCRQDWGPDGYVFEVIEEPEEDKWAAVRKYCEDDVHLANGLYGGIPFVKIPSGGSDGEATFRYNSGGLYGGKDYSDKEHWTPGREEQSKDRTRRAEIKIPWYYQTERVEIKPLDFAAIEERSLRYMEEKVRQAFACPRRYMK